MSEAGETVARSSSGAPASLAATDRLVLMLLRGLASGLLWLPRGAIGPLSALLGGLARLASARDRRICRQNLHRVLGLEPGSAESKRMQRAVFRSSVEIALESVRAIQRPEELRIDGLEELREPIARAEASGLGHLIVAAHLGSWELVARSCAEVGTRPFHVLAKPAPNAGVTAFLEELRERAGNDVFWTDRRSLLREMLAALRRNESLGFVMDQKPEGRRGPVVQFFGWPCEFARGPASLAVRTGCPVIAVSSLRVGPFHYRLRVERLLEAGHGETDERTLTQEMASAIERAIREAPEQWSWSYRRWYFDEVSPVADEDSEDDESAPPR